MTSHCPVAAVSAALLLAAASSGSAAPAASEAKSGVKAAVSPQARVLLAKMFRALGGRDKVAAVQALHVKMEAQAADLGITATLETQSKGRKVRVRTVFSESMAMEQGFDGQRAWSKDMVFGLRELKGGEREALVGTSVWAAAHPEEFYDRIVAGEPTVFGERRAEQLVQTKGQAERTIVYLDAKTFLPLGMRTTAASPMGMVTTTTRNLSFSRSKSGVRFANRVRIENGPTQLTGDVVEYRENPKLSDRSFAMPKR